MERGAVQIEVRTQRLEPRSVGEQEPDRADVAVVRAPLDEGDASVVGRGRGKPSRDYLEYEVGSPIRNSIDHNRLPPSAQLSTSSLTFSFTIVIMAFITALHVPASASRTSTVTQSHAVGGRARPRGPRRSRRPRALTLTL